ncbi:hypothetical protein WOLCODRAFT_17733 [Wolfiporia cocos MD-104 SS10]|uniref:Uncharacterized protein n=1 Tax=Wolfiporia cocos (strain MD-104) TaxID=742152 RepID=A0A2H3JKP9_WOLCO|nr:hypothetical protein WOLCODRAFT_17733 [Wolfiporia cocos MD-104 SS10]
MPSVASVSTLQEPMAVSAPITPASLTTSAVEVSAVLESPLDSASIVVSSRHLSSSDKISASSMTPTVDSAQKRPAEEVHIEDSLLKRVRITDEVESIEPPSPVTPGPVNLPNELETSTIAATTDQVDLPSIAEIIAGINANTLKRSRPYKPGSSPTAENLYGIEWVAQHPGAKTCVYKRYWSLLPEHLTKPYVDRAEQMRTSNEIICRVQRN